MKVVLAPEGSRGDTQPLLALGQALVRRGCQVEMCASDDTRPMAEAGGLSFVPLGHDNRAYLESQARAVVGGGLGMQRAMARYTAEILDQQFGPLLEAARGADLVVGGGVQFGGPSVAEAVGAAYRFVAYCPIVFPSAEHPPFLFERQIRRRWLNRVGWRLTLGALQALLRPTLNRRRAELGLPPVADLHAYLRSPRPLLACDPDLGPAPADLDFAVDSVGYLYPEQPAPLGDKLEAFLAAGPPPVYLGFGSMTDPHPQETTRVLLDAVERAGLRAVIGAGWAGLGRAPLGGNVMVAGDVPHAKLFPRMAAVVHHAGSGTTHTAARAGVPQIPIPHLLDQFYWARRVAELGIGPPALPRRKLSGERLAGLLEAIAGNEILAERAAELAERMRSRDPLAAAVARLPGLPD